MKIAIKREQSSLLELPNVSNLSKLEKTRLKLLESQVEGKLIGFVSRHPKTGKLLGVREGTHYGKKICLISDHLHGKLKPNTLYEVSLKRMRSGAGYVIVKAELVLFVAHIKVTIIPQKTYQIVIEFGHKVIYFDPINGRTPSSNTLKGVLDLLNEREDIANKTEIIQSFVLEAGKLLDRMVKDGVKL